jgi:archaellum component FlaG (FlaF/FlaG flagellin family)
VAFIDPIFKGLRPISFTASIGLEYSFHTLENFQTISSVTTAGPRHFGIIVRNAGSEYGALAMSRVEVLLQLRDLPMRGLQLRSVCFNGVSSIRKFRSQGRDDLLLGHLG